MNRRSFIRILGGGVILAAGAGYAVRDRLGPVPAVANAPWREAGSGHPDLRRRILSYAILAPNPHNLQPWRVDLSEPDVITLRHDPERLLKETDPFSRQLVIGHGCLVETAAIAASAFGRDLAVEPFPEGEPTTTTLADRPIARMTLRAPTGGRDPLFDAILRRRSIKEPFDPARPAAPETLSALAAAAAERGARLTLSSEPGVVEPVRQLLGEAMELELRTERTAKESIDLLRIGADEIALHRDGIDLGGPKFEMLKLLGLMDRKDMLDPASAGFKGTLESYWAIARATPTVAWMTTPGNDRKAQLAAGRAYMRLALAATAAGLAMHPMSQILQEYPEMAALQRRFLEIARPGAGEQVQMLVRLGYAAATEPSPRRPLDRIIVT